MYLWISNSQTLTRHETAAVSWNSWLLAPFPAAPLATVYNINRGQLARAGLQTKYWTVLCHARLRLQATLRERLPGAMADKKWKTSSIAIAITPDHNGHTKSVLCDPLKTYQNFATPKLVIIKFLLFKTYNSSMALALH